LKASKEHVDTLPVTITGECINQLLDSVPKIASGTGEAQASTVKGCLEKWGMGLIMLVPCVSISFTATRVDTGR